MTILSTLPSAGLGALLAMEVTGDESSIVFPMIGIILLIGIVKKNAIMMVDFALEAERHQGLSPEDSIYQACLVRFRPIMTTTIAAMFGALPLAIGMGVGSELRKPLGVAIVGGLIVSRNSHSVYTPVIYLWLDQLRHRRKHKQRAGYLARSSIGSSRVSACAQEALSAPSFSSYLIHDADLADADVHCPIGCGESCQGAGRIGQSAGAEAIGRANRARSDQIARSDCRASVGAVVLELPG